MGRRSIPATAAFAVIFVACASWQATASGTGVSTVGFRIVSTAGFRIVATHKMESRFGEPVISIKGEITNETERERAVPHVRLAVSDAQGREIYHWTVVADRERLGPHQSCTFSARAEIPPAESASIDVRLGEKGE